MVKSSELSFCDTNLYVESNAVLNQIPISIEQAAYTRCKVSCVKTFNFAKLKVLSNLII